MEQQFNVKCGDIIKCNLGLSHPYALVLGIMDEMVQIMWLYEKEADSLSFDTFNSCWENTCNVFPNFEGTLNAITNFLEGIKE